MNQHIKSPWLPIETRSMDNFLALTGVSIFEVYYDGRHFIAQDPRGGGEYILNEKITHWMPLPPAPNTADEE